MKVNIRADSVEIEGYVNAIERNSKPLQSRIGRFIERICKGAFFNALKRNDDVHILLNHDPTRDLGSTKQGNLELKEDSIGLHARATICDADVVSKARNGELVGWSFGFEDVPNGVEELRDQETGLPLRKVKDLYLAEVSILDRTRTPAYDGTLLMARSENDEVQYRAEPFIDEVEVEEEKAEEKPKAKERPEEKIEERSEKTPEEPETKKVDYSPWEAIIKEMRRKVMSSKEMIKKQNDLITRAEILPSVKGGSTRSTTQRRDSLLRAVAL